MTARNATIEDRNIAYARLHGLDAWNGNGLLIFLASTSKKDKEREWMEPLRDACEAVVEGVDAGETVKLDVETARAFDGLADYAKAFAHALDHHDRPDPIPHRQG